MIKKEVHTFFTALMFFTRIPCPKWVQYSDELLTRSARYFSLVGILVGSLAALVFYGGNFLFTKEIAILLSMVASIYITGAFHEDGFADVCDGLGGGWTKERILTIMKDSRIGTYGSVGLIGILALKFAALQAIPTVLIPIVIISGHSFSRFIATTLIYTHPYVRNIDSSKVKPAAKSMSMYTLLSSFIFGTLPLLYFKSLTIFLVFIPCYLSKMYLGHKFKKWIGGQTGDCAGAVQQLAEVVFYLSCITLWKFFS